MFWKTSRALIWAPCLPASPLQRGSALKLQRSRSFSDVPVPNGTGHSSGAAVHRADSQEVRKVGSTMPASTSLQTLKAAPACLLAPLHHIFLA